METLRQELFPDFVDSAHVVRVLVRLVMATILGGLVGIERETEHKAAGWRTQMLVALGSALFVLVPLEMRISDITRVVQGITAGIGFLGAGTIFKLTDRMEVKGLTSAASIWITAAIGMAVGAGMMGPAVVAVVLSLIILFCLHTVERWVRPWRKNRSSANGSGQGQP
jgi:putative Mg2+ transporter-C (MgtC) family protein